MPLALKCFDCKETFDSPSQSEFCPNCCTDNITTWVYEEVDKEAEAV